MNFLPLISATPPAVKEVGLYRWKTISCTNASNDVIIGDNTLENAFYSITLDSNGNICSLIDKRLNREFVQSGETINRLQVYEDYPKEYDAWEITDYYKQKVTNLDYITCIEKIENEVAKGFKIVRNYLNSIITQRIWVYSGNVIDRIDVENEIDWKESHKLLKASFPVNVHASEVRCEIQFGNVKRPTHSNTSWDEAKFEVCAHKFADISDNTSGFAILNDCKYGYSCEGSNLKLTLLKCATHPNPEADKGLHTFTYSIYPHVGNFESSDVIKNAYLLNSPFEAVLPSAKNNELPDCYSFVSSSNENVIIETVKMAENDEDIIVGMYESRNGTEKTSVNFGFDVEKVYITDMLENVISELEVKNNSVDITLGNFEIVTIKASVRK